MTSIRHLTRAGSIARQAFLGSAFSVASACALAAPSVVWDWSPVRSGVLPGQWGTYTAFPSAYYLERVSFAEDMVISGIDTYALAYGRPEDGVLPCCVKVGTPVVISIWGQTSPPNTVYWPEKALASYTSEVSAVDLEGGGDLRSDVYQSFRTGWRIHADFAGFTMKANTTYWIGMAPDSTKPSLYAPYEENGLLQVFLTNQVGGDHAMAACDALGCGHLATAPLTGDMAFRLYGASATVPEPSTWALVGAGLLMLPAFIKRRRQTDRQ